MFRITTAALGTGLVAIALAGAPAARADSGDAALAFVVGAAFGHAIDGHHRHLRPLPRRPYVYVPPRHRAHYTLRWHERQPQHWRGPSRDRHGERFDAHRRGHDRGRRGHDGRRDGWRDHR